MDAVAVAVLLEELVHRARELGPALGLERAREHPRRTVGVEERLPHVLARLARLWAVALDELEVEDVAMSKLASSWGSRSQSAT